MGPILNYYLDAMRKYADFSGRATRSQYWFFSLAMLGIIIAVLIIDQLIAYTQPEGASLLAGLVYLAHLIPSIAISVRRLHDINKSGWWLLLLFVPFAGAIALLVFMCTPSTPGLTRYGEIAGQSQHPIRPQHNQQIMTGSLQSLEKLASLRASGAIDEEEYKQLKANILTQPAH